MRKKNAMTALLLSVFACACSSESMEPTLAPENQPSKSSNSHHIKSNVSQEKFVLVHGAWHPQESWDLVKAGLEKRGHRVATVQLSGLGLDESAPATVTLPVHVEDVKEAVMQMGEGVTLIGHSYGGIVVSQVAEDMPEYVDKIIYLSAFLPVDGEALTDLAPLDTASVAGKSLIIDPANSIAYLPEAVHQEAFYNTTIDGASPQTLAEVHRIMDLLKPQPLATFAMPVQLGEDFNKIEKVYISCTKDNSITPDFQKYMYSRYPGIEVIELKGSDHSPFLTKPQKTITLFHQLSKN